MTTLRVHGPRHSIQRVASSRETSRQPGQGKYKLAVSLLRIHGVITNSTLVAKRLVTVNQTPTLQIANPGDVNLETVFEEVREQVGVGVLVTSTQSVNNINKR